MPTGYTAKLMEKGQSFPEFVMTCARSFGALITMRDDPMDAEIPEKFEPSPYYKNALADAHAEFARLRDMSPEEQLAYGEKAKADTIAKEIEWLARDTEENVRLQMMEARVKEWEPPTPEHVELKNFMLQQLDISKRDTGYIKRYLAEAQAKEPMQYYRDALAKAERSIKYHTEEMAKEQERMEGRTEWVRQLRESLKN